MLRVSFNALIHYKSAVGCYKFHRKSYHLHIFHVGPHIYLTRIQYLDIFTSKKLRNVEWELNKYKLSQQIPVLSCQGRHHTSVSPGILQVPVEVFQQLMNPLSALEAVKPFFLKFPIPPLFFSFQT